MKGRTVVRSGAEREEVLEAEPLEECTMECHAVDPDSIEASEAD